MRSDNIYMELVELLNDIIDFIVNEQFPLYRLKYTELKLNGLICIVFFGFVENMSLVNQTKTVFIETVLAQISWIFMCPFIGQYLFYENRLLLYPTKSRQKQRKKCKCHKRYQNRHNQWHKCNYIPLFPLLNHRMVKQSRSQPPAIFKFKYLKNVTRLEYIYVTS